MGGFTTFLALQGATRRVRPEDPLARGVLDAPEWLVILVLVLVSVGVVAVLVRRARKRR